MNEKKKKILIINCFDTYERRVDLLLSSFVGLGYDANVITSNYRHFEKTIRMDNKDNYVYIPARPYSKNLSLKRIKSHQRLSKDIFEYILKKESDADVLWILLPPNSFAKDVAEYKKRNPKIKVVFDIIDMWPETMPVGKVKSIWPFSAWKNLRDKHVGVADFIVTECNMYRSELSGIIKDKDTETLYFAKDVCTDIQRKSGYKTPEEINLLYLGSINNIVDIDAIKDICNLIRKEYKVRIHIIGDGESKDKLLEVLSNNNIEYEYYGTVYDEENKALIIDKCDFGLNIMKDSVVVGMTMKSLDYFSYGLPIINNIKGDTSEAVEKYDIGINYSSGNLTIRIIDRENVIKFYRDNFTIEVFEKKIARILSVIDGDNK